jgi:chemotaxis regulatin CheY-phosphate phosphatase CheZ
MDQSEIDALMKVGGSKSPKSKKSEKAEPSDKVESQKEAVPPAPLPLAAAEKTAVHRDAEGHVLVEIDAVTEVTERETNKLLDQLDLISQLVGRQQTLITEILSHPGTQDLAVQTAINQVMGAAKEIQSKVFEAMDLMQFQDITRQKLERIVHHLRQIHDYIVDLLGSGQKNEPAKASISRTIAQTGTTPDERKSHADAVIDEFRRGKNQKD